MHQAPLKKILVSPSCSGLASKVSGTLKSIKLQPVACNNAWDKALISEYPSKVPSFEAFASSMKLSCKSANVSFLICWFGKNAAQSAATEYTVLTRVFLPP